MKSTNQQDNPEYILTALKKIHGTAKLGRELIAQCPKCKRIKLYINARTFKFHCFRCKWSGQIKSKVGQLTVKSPEITGTFEIEQELGKFERLSSFKHSKPYYQYLAKRGISKAIADGTLQAGVSSTWRYWNRLILPVYENKEMVFFVARAINGEEPKELSPSGSPKQNYVYGIDFILPGSPVVITEGIFDAESVSICGYIGVAILGSAISDIQIGKILAKKPSDILILLDGDKAGTLGSNTAISKFKKRGFFCSSLSLPAGTDPNSLGPIQLKYYLDSVIYQ